MQSQVKTYCIIRDADDNSFSPSKQNADFNSLGLNCMYIAYLVPKGQLKESINSLKAVGIS